MLFIAAHCVNLYKHQEEGNSTVSNTVSTHPTGSYIMNCAAGFNASLNSKSKSIQVFPVLFKGMFFKSLIKRFFLYFFPL